MGFLIKNNGLCAIIDRGVFTWTEVVPGGRVALSPTSSHVLPSMKKVVPNDRAKNSPFWANLLVVLRGGPLDYWLLTTEIKKHTCLLIMDEAVFR